MSFIKKLFNFSPSKSTIVSSGSNPPPDPLPPEPPEPRLTGTATFQGIDAIRLQEANPDIPKGGTEEAKRRRGKGGGTTNLTSAARQRARLTGGRNADTLGGGTITRPGVFGSQLLG